MGYGLETTPATDNLPPRGDVYPDQDAPVLRPAPRWRAAGAGEPSMGLSANRQGQGGNYQYSQSAKPLVARCE